MSDVKCPGVYVKLSGKDGNAFMIIGRTTTAMKRAKVEKAIVDEYMKEAMSGDYDHLLQTTMRYVECN